MLFLSSTHAHSHEDRTTADCADERQSLDKMNYGLIQFHVLEYSHCIINILISLFPMSSAPVVTIN